MILHLQLLFWSILLQYKAQLVAAQNLTRCAKSMACLTVWEHHNDKIRHVRVTPIGNDDEKHKKFLRRMKNRQLETPHCFINAVDGNPERHRIWCYCLNAVKEACTSRKAIAESIYQGKRDPSSRALNAKEFSVSNEVLDSVFVGLLGKFHDSTFSYNVTMRSCELGHSKIETDDNRIAINFDHNKTTVKIKEEKFLMKDGESPKKLLVPLAVLTEIRENWEKLSEERNSLRCAYNNFREQIVDPILKKYGMWPINKMQTPRKMPLPKTRSSDDWLQYLPTICCWLLTAPFVIPLLLTAIGALVDWKDEERCKLHSDSSSSGGPRDVESEIRNEICRNRLAGEITPKSMSSPKKVRSLENVHMAVSMEPTNDTDLGSDLSQMSAMPKHKDTPKAMSKEGKSLPGKIG